jgi:tetratricopeptide (TPR) repeat protein
MRSSVSQEKAHSVCTLTSSKPTGTNGTRRKCSIRHKRGKHLAAAETRWRALLSHLESCPKVPKDHAIHARRNLAVTLRYQRKYKEAESHQRQIRQDLVEVHGVDHPKTLASTSNLAVVLCDQHKYEAAESLLQGALLGCQKTLGVQHAATLACQHNLALLYLGQSNGEKAVVTIERALAAKRALYAPRYPPSLLASMLTMAWILQQQARVVEAIELYDESLEGSLQTLGPEHNVTLACRAVIEGLEGRGDETQSTMASHSPGATNIQ